MDDYDWLSLWWQTFEYRIERGQSGQRENNKIDTWFDIHNVATLKINWFFEKKKGRLIRHKTVKQGQVNTRTRRDLILLLVKKDIFYFRVNLEMPMWAVMRGE